MVSLDFERIFLPIVTLFFISLYHTTEATPDDQIIIRLEGKILDASTLEPVAAKLTYELMPGGNVTGIRMFSNEDGDYYLELEKYRSYKIEVKSKDYQPRQLVISTTGKQSLENDFLLYRIPSKGEVFPFSSKIFFERGDHKLDECSLPTIEALANIMQDHPKMVIRLEGHTDQGTSRSLVRLSESRVEEVKRYLIDVMGVNKKRIKTKAFGGRKPISTEDTAEARQKNRRVEIRVLKL